MNQKKIIKFLQNTISNPYKQPLLTHPLGFLSWKIGPVDEFDGSIRIHYWPINGRKYKQPNWQIHTHNFHLKSHILMGCITNIDYERSSPHTTGLWHEFKATYQNQTTSIESTGKTFSLNKKSEITHKGGEVYEVKKGTFHQSVVDINSECLTLAIESHKDTSADPIIAGSQSTGKFVFHYEEADKNIILEALRKSICMHNAAE